MEAKKPAEKLFTVRLTHDYWASKGHLDKTTGEWVEDRIKAGTTIEVPLAEAERLLDAKKAERVDPLQ